MAIIRSAMFPLRHMCVKFLCYLAFNVVFLLNDKCESTIIPNRSCEVHYKHGDAIIGGIFPIYYSNSKPCDGGLRIQRISMIESMSYAIRYINEQDNILPNVSLGYEIRNDCSNEEISLWTMITLTSDSGFEDYNNACPHYERKNETNAISVIGTSRSSTSLLAAKVGAIYDVPLISYYATSDELSNSPRYPYFYRTIPPDKFQVNAIVDILLRYNWKYIALFFSIDSYGIHGARQIQSFAEKHDICIVTNMPLPDRPTESEVEDIAERLKENDKVTVIVMFCTWDEAQAVVRAITEHGITRKFTFIGSDGWGPDHDVLDAEYLTFLHGSIFIRPYAEATQSFHQYYRQLPYMQEHASQWYRDKLQEIYVSNMCTDWSSCPIPVPHLETQVMNGVFATAYALDASVRQNCPDNLMCEAALGTGLQKHLLNVSFTNAGEVFTFDENGDPFGKYVVQNWQVGENRLVDVGFWDPQNVSHRLSLDIDHIQWGLPDGEVPFSLCVEECSIGQIAIPLEKKCCWGCQKCNEFAVVIDGSECSDCSEIEWPNANRTICVPIEPVYLESEHPVFIITIAVSVFGLLLTGLCGLAMCYHRKHTLVKASSLELSGVNIFGLALSCAAALSTIFRPTTSTCIASEFLLSLCFCVTFAPLLLKVNRIWRIFSSAKKSASRPRFVNPKHQLIITSGVIAIQFIISIVSALITPSIPQFLIPYPRQQLVTLFCELSIGFTVATAYNLVLILCCCYYAFKARKVPDNYNESKFIAISVYSTLIACLAAIPVYSTAADVAQRIATLAVVALVNTYLTLVCMYLSKFYAILFLNEETSNWRTSGESSINQVQPTKASTMSTVAPQEST